MNARARTSKRSSLSTPLTEPVYTLSHLCADRSANRCKRNAKRPAVVESVHSLLCGQASMPSDFMS